MNKIIAMTLAAGLILTGCQSEQPAESVNSEETVEAIVIEGAESDDQKVDESASELVEITESEIDQTTQGEDQSTEDLSEEESDLYWCTDIEALLLSEGHDPTDSATAIQYMNEVKALYDAPTVDRMALHLIDILENARIFGFEAKTSEFLKPFESEDLMLSDEKFNALLGDNAEFKAFVAELKANGFKINYSIHWNPFVDVSYETVEETLSANASEEMSAYLSILSTESAKHYLGSSYDDMTRSISLDELVSRILMTEQFLKDYPESELADRVRLYNTEYLYEYLYGHTKYDTSFDWMSDTVKLHEAFESHYKKTIEENKDSKLAKLLTDYLESIENNGGEVDRQNRMIESPEYILSNHIWKNY